MTFLPLRGARSPLFAAIEIPFRSGFEFAHIESWTAFQLTVCVSHGIRNYACSYTTP